MGVNLSVINDIISQFSLFFKLFWRFLGLCRFLHIMSSLLSTSWIVSFLWYSVADCLWWFLTLFLEILEKDLNLPLSVSNWPYLIQKQIGKEWLLPDFGPKQSGSDWPQVGKIQDFFRSEFSTLAWWCKM